MTTQHPTTVTPGLEIAEALATCYRHGIPVVLVEDARGRFEVFMCEKSHGPSIPIGRLMMTFDVITKHAAAVAQFLAESGSTLRCSRCERGERDVAASMMKKASLDEGKISVMWGPAFRKLESGRVTCPACAREYQSEYPLTSVAPVPPAILDALDGAPLVASWRTGWTREAVSVDAWNVRVPAGALVRYYPFEGSTTYRRTRTRSAAWVLPSGHPVVLVERQAGGVLLSHLQVLSTESGEDDAASVATPVEPPKLEVRLEPAPPLGGVVEAFISAQAFCPECGPVSDVDDQCWCRACGARCTGTALDELRQAVAEMLRQQRGC